MQPLGHGQVFPCVKAAGKFVGDATAIQLPRLFISNKHVLFTIGLDHVG